MVEKGITLEDVEAEMKRRAEKQHNLKAERKTIENY
jgi:phosphoribosyl-ATP pyrophosphohydrolase